MDSAITTSAETPVTVQEAVAQVSYRDREGGDEEVMQVLLVTVLIEM